MSFYLGVESFVDKPASLSLFISPFPLSLLRVSPLPTPLLPSPPPLPVSDKQKKQIIFERGDRGSEMYLVVDGIVALSLASRCNLLFAIY